MAQTEETTAPRHRENMNRGGRRFRPRRAIASPPTWILVALVVGVLGAGSATAQAPARDASAVAAEIASLQAQTGLDASVRDAAVAVFKEAQAEFERADLFRTRVRELQDAAESATETVERLRATKPLADLPEVPENSDSDTLEARLLELESRLARARLERTSTENQLTELSQRRLEAPVVMARLRSAIDNLKETVSTAGLPESRARATAGVARREALEAELAVLETAQSTYEPRRTGLTARRDFAARLIEVLLERMQRIEDLARKARAEESTQAQQLTSALSTGADEAHPALDALLAELAAYSEQLHGPTGVLRRIGWVETARRETTERLNRLTTQLKAVQEKSAVVGFTDSLGLLLRRQRSELPDPRELDRRIEKRSDRIAEVQIAQLELQDRRLEFVASADPLADFMAGLDPPAPNDQLDAIAERAKQLLDAKSRAVEDLLLEYDRYFVALVDNDGRQREYRDAVIRYREFIDTHVLWIRSAPPWGFRELEPAFRAIVWLFDPIRLYALGGSFVAGAVARPVATLVCLLALFSLLYYRPLLRRRLSELYTEANQGSGISVPQAGEYVALTLVVSAIRPAAFLIPSLALRTAVSDGHAHAIGSGLQAVAYVYWSANLLRILCVKQGLAQAVFGWPGSALSVVYRTLTRALPVLLVAVFVEGVFHSLENEIFSSSLGRLSFITATLTAAFMAWRILRANGPVLDVLTDRASVRWTSQAARLGAWLVPGAFLALAVATIIGYAFSARELAVRVIEFYWCLLTVGVLQALALRWIAVKRRDLARDQSTDSLGPAESQPEGDIGDAPVPDEPLVDLSVIDTQTRGLLRLAVLVAWAWATWWVWSDVAPALWVFDKAVLWTIPGTDGLPLSVVTLGSLLVALTAMVMTTLACRNIGGLIELAGSRVLGGDAGLRYAVTAIARYTIFAGGFTFTLQALGVRWSQVQWLVAAMSVGLGFGLQEIFANFVSGLILLFERPVRVGDTVTLNSVNGTVTKIRIRATTIVDWDRKELVVPNKDFITGQLINWSLSDRTLRVVIPVGIAYGSDTATAERVLLEVAKKSPLVLETPPATALFRSFGDNSLVFDLRVFIASIENYWRAQHNLHMEIDRAFRAEGIEISFPQRDLHLRSVEGAIPVVIREAAKSDEG